MCICDCACMCAYVCVCVCVCVHVCLQVCHGSQIVMQILHKIKSPPAIAQSFSLVAACSFMLHCTLFFKVTLCLVCASSNFTSVV